MNTKYYQDIEQMIVSAREMNEVDFDAVANKYLNRISAEEKDAFCEALAAFHGDRIRQFMNVNHELDTLSQLEMTKETVNMFEMAF
jgi:hypothetical protein